MNSSLEIRHKGTVKKLDVNEILYIKSDNVYVEIFTEGNRFIQRKFLSQISEELPNQFVRIHRSYLVNLDQVTNRKKSYFMIDNTKIPVSRKFKITSMLGEPCL